MELRLVKREWDRCDGTCFKVTNINNVSYFLSLQVLQTRSFNDGQGHTDEIKEWVSVPMVWDYEVGA